jgi:hypothetical protein
MTLLEYTLEKYYDSIFSEERFCWSSMTSNPCISIQFIMVHLHYPWCWSSIMMNPKFTYETYQQYEEIIHDKCGDPKNNSVYWQYICQNTPIHFIEKHPEIEWDYYGISQNETLTHGFIEKYIDKLYLGFVCKNKCVTMDIIESIFEMNSDHKYDSKLWTSILQNPNLTREFVTKYIDIIKRNYYRSILLSRMNIFDIEFLERHNIILCYKNLTLNPDLTEQYILENFSKFEEFIHKITFRQRLLTNKNMSFEFLRDYVCDSLSYLSGYPNLPSYILDKLHEQPELDWGWNALTSNPSITMEFIKSHPEYPWCWGTIFKNPNCETKFIIEFYNKIKEYPLYSLWNQYPLSRELIDSIPPNANGISCNTTELNEKLYTKLYWIDRKDKTIELCQKYKEELIETAWSPDRPNFMSWCISKHDLNHVSMYFRI